MKKLFTTIACVALFSGCALTDWAKPTFPTVPPPKPEKPTVKSRADVETKDPSAKPEQSSKAETRSRAPVNASQITERNAQDVARALDAELEQETNKPVPKP